MGNEFCRLSLQNLDNCDGAITICAALPYVDQLRGASHEKPYHSHVRIDSRVEEVRPWTRNLTSTIVATTLNGLRALATNRDNTLPSLRSKHHIRRRSSLLSKRLGNRHSRQTRSNRISRHSKVPSLSRSSLHPNQRRNNARNSSRNLHLSLHRNSARNDSRSPHPHPLTGGPIGRLTHSSPYPNQEKSPSASTLCSKSSSRY